MAGESGGTSQHPPSHVFLAGGTQKRVRFFRSSRTGTWHLQPVQNPAMQDGMIVLGTFSHSAPPSVASSLNR